MALTLLGPLGAVTPSGAQAPPEAEQDPPEEEQAETPFWRVLRAQPQEGEETAAPWTTENLNAVHMPTEEVGYAVGDNGAVLKTTDRGDTWSAWRLSSGKRPGPHLYGVHFRSERVGVVVGAETNEQNQVTAGLILATLNGGGNWLRIESGADKALRSVDFPTSTIGYAVGDPTGGSSTVLKTTDGGRSWDRLSAPSGQALYAVRFADDKHGVAVGDQSADAGLIISTEDGGQHWKGITRSGTRTIRGAALLEPKGVGYAVGRAAAAQAGSVLRTSDGFAAAEDERTVRTLRAVTAYHILETEVQGDDVETAVEVVHAVGDERQGAAAGVTAGPLPVALTRRAEQGGEQGSKRPWAVEPIEDWPEHVGKELRAVSASPGGETVVAVGSGGLMLRRATGPAEVVETICVPPELAEALKNEDGQSLVPPEIRVCPENGEAADPEEKEALVIPSPSITLTPAKGAAGEAFRASGEHWVACQDPVKKTGCRGSRVKLSFRQANPDGTTKVSSLGSAQAGANGTFEHGVVVPSKAVDGTAVVLAEGDPAPDGGPSAEATYTVLAVSISLTPPAGNPGDALTVSGRGWHACRPTCQGSKVDLVFRQGPKEFSLLDAPVQAASGGTFNVQVPVPAKVVKGEAIVRALAVGSPTPDGGVEATALFDVFTECKTSLKNSNPEFPCVGVLGPLINELGQPIKDEQGSPVAPGFLQFDPGLGDSGRAVATLGSRIFLFDAKSMSQRGVKGFGAYFKKTSADGEATGVVNLGDAGDAGLSGGAPALDARNHRLYFVSTVNGAIRMTAVSLTGEFAPTTKVVEETAVPLREATHFVVDGSNGMLYAATTSGVTGSQTNLVWTPQRDVVIHAVSAELDEQTGHMALELRWSLTVGDLCGSTKHPGLRFFAASRDGRRLSLACQGTDFFFFGSPQGTPNGMLVVTLPEGRKPAEFVQNDTEAFGRHLEVVPGGGMGSAPEAQKVVGDLSTGVASWIGSGRVLFWDADGARWIGSMSERPELFAGDPRSRRLYLRVGGNILNLFEVANMPGRAERSGPEAVSIEVSPVGTGAFDPKTRRLVVWAEGARGMAVLEDRIPPPVALADPNPDDRTNDIEEEEAFSVDRRGAAASYGARVWWTGLRGALPGTYLIKGDTNSGQLNPNNVQPPPGGTYPWLYANPNFGPHTSRLPWKPHETQREVFAARVQESELESGNSALASPTGLSRATAWGLHIDDGTGADVRGRRGVREWRDAGAATVETFCENLGPPRDDCRKRWSGDPQATPTPRPGFRDDWQSFYYGNQPGLNNQLAPLDGCVLELSDRLTRELDGERRVHQCTQLNEGEEKFYGGLQWGEDEFNENAGEENQVGVVQELRNRAGLEQHLGLTQRSRCAQPGEEERASTQGSAVDCRLEPGRESTTVAAAEIGASGEALQDDADASDTGFAMEFPGGVSLKVSGSFSGTHLARTTDDQGRRLMVSEAVAVASGVEVAAGGGALRVGEVRTVARANAGGRAGTASSTYEVSFHDVTVSGPTGEALFTCGPEGVGYSHPQRDAVDETVGKFPDLLKEAAKEAHGAFDELPCDPQSLSNVLLRVLPQVQIDVPSRDTDELVVGTKKGARSIVRRNRTDFYNDEILFNVRRDEVPGLQLTIASDGTEFNRYRVDLAGVFAESRYLIGTKTPPASLEVSLTDPLGVPLEGGNFEVVADRDADGAVGTVDTAVERCVTGPDGVGTCRISALEPGSYLVHQTAAPPGYLPQAGPMAVQLAPGGARRVEFVNIRSAGTVEVTLVDPSGDPLEGGSFELAHESGAATSCSTDAQGRCEMWPLPLGRYVLSQTRAPARFEVAEPISFALTTPGQVARVRVINGVVGSGESRAQVVIVEGTDLTSKGPGDRWWRRAARGLAQVIARNPWQALALLMLAALLAAPGVLALRRRELAMMRELT